MCHSYIFSVWGLVWSFKLGVWGLELEWDFWFGVQVWAYLTYRRRFTYSSICAKAIRVQLLSIFK